MMNISRLDRSVRVWVGLAMIVGSVQNNDLLPWTLVGAFLIGTAWQGFCPLYAATGYSPAYRRS